MRVTSGTKKGTILWTKADMSIRPTADKIKQSIFNMIQFSVRERAVLDLFSGSGALGIEALSRGADFCTFVDTDTEAAEKNIKKVSFESRSLIVKNDFASFLKNKASGKYSLVFLDPPYKKGYIDEALRLMYEKKLLSEDALIILECDITEEIFIPESYNIKKEISYGRVKIFILVLLEGG